MTALSSVVASVTSYYSGLPSRTVRVGGERVDGAGLSTSRIVPFASDVVPDPTSVASSVPVIVTVKVSSSSAMSSGRASTEISPVVEPGQNQGAGDAGGVGIVDAALGGYVSDRCS